jgi:NADH-quinone oxidoreductase subunit M
MVLSAVYLLTMFQKVFLGESRDAANAALRDLNWREVLAVAPLIALCFVIGLQATPFFNLMSSSVAGLLAASGLALR